MPTARLIVLLIALGHVTWAQIPKPGELPAAGIKAPAVAPPLPGEWQGQEPKKAAPVAPASVPRTVPAITLGKGKMESSTSSSGQFIVHGNDLTLRSAVAGRCDEIDQELRQLLRDRQPWVLPIVIMLQPPENAAPQAPPIRMTLSEITHGGFHIQLDAALRADLQPALLRAEVVRALLAERVLRLQKGSPKRQQLLPQWMLTGVLEAMDYRRLARPSALFGAIFKSGKIYSIDEIIDAEVDALDGISRTIYRSSCCALVLALLDQPEGSTRLQRFLGTLAADARPLKTLLDEAFPSFATSPTSLNKWWALQLANLSRPGLSEPLSTTESLAALEDALTLRYRAKASEIPEPMPTELPAEQPPSASTTKPEPPAIGGNLATRLFRWLNPFSRRSNQADDALQQAIASNQQSDEQGETDPSSEIQLPDTAAEGARVKASDEQRPWYNRWFGGSRRPKTEAQEPKTTPPAETPEPGKKPRGLLRWFKSSALPSSSPKDQHSPNPWLRDWQTQSPLVALVLQSSAKPSKAEAAPATAPASAAPTKRRFRLFGSDKPAPASTTPAAAPAPAPNTLAAPSKKKDNTREKAATAPSASRLPPSLIAQPALNEKPAAMPAASASTTASAAAPATATTPATPAAGTPTTRKRGLFGGLFDNKPAAAPATTPAMPATAPASSTDNKTNKKTSDSKPRPATAPSASRLPPSLIAQPALNEKPAAMPAASASTTASAAAPATATAPATPAAGTPTTRKRGLFGGLFDNKPAAAPATTPAMPAAAPASPDTAAAANKDGEGKPSVRSGSRAKLQNPKPAAPAEKPAPKKSEAKPLPKPADKPMSDAAKPTATPQPEPKKAEAKPLPKPADKPMSDAAKPKADEPLVDAALPIENFEAVLKRPDRQEIFKRCITALSVLQQRSAVLLRPIIGQYLIIVTELSEGKNRDAAKRLGELRKQLNQTAEQSRAIRDLLDVHEANSSPAMSGTFEDYLRLPQTIEQELPPRSDAISRYLDALDREFSKP